jgi:hypothetical protein
MRVLQVLYPVSLAAANLAIGASLYGDGGRGALLGASILAVGALVCCGVAVQAVGRVAAGRKLAGERENL